MNDIDKLAYESALSQLPASLRAYAAKKYSQEQRKVLPLPYWSTIRIRSTVSGAGPFTYTIDTTTRTAFQYARGDVMDIAGFAAGTAATFADTNLTSKATTLDNADVVIWGLAIEVCPNSDPLLAGAIFRDSFITLSLNGTNTYVIGNPGMFPCAGSLYGNGYSRLKAGPTNQAGGAPETLGQQASFISNGNPMAGNFYRFPQPWTWYSIGSPDSNSDTSLNISLVPANRTITVTAPSDRAAVPVVGAVTPGTIEPYTHPAAAAEPFVDLRFRLVSVSIGPRSGNS